MRPSFSVGEKVFVRPGAVVTADDKLVHTSILKFPTSICDVNNDLLRVEDCWVRKDDAMSAGEAIEWFGTLIKAHPHSAHHRINRAAVYSYVGDFGSAIHDCTVALSIEPSHWQAYDRRGDAWFLRGEYEKALADLSKSIELKPTAAALAGRGRTYIALNHLDNAFRDFTNALLHDPKNKYALRGLGLTFQLRGELPRAIDEFTKALEVDNELEETHYNRGMAFYLIGDFDRAIVDYDAAIRLNPQRWNSYLTRGGIHMAKGNFGNALADFEFVLHSGHVNDRIFANLAWLKATCPDETFRNGTESVEFACKALELAKPVEWFHYRAGAAALAESGDFVTALRMENEVHRRVAGEERENSAHRQTLYGKGVPYRLVLRAGTGGQVWS